MAGSAIGKIKASRVNNLDAAEYVGPDGQMWYDVDTGLLRLGDNVTPGGIVVGGGGGNGSPGGPNHSIQFNNAGVFGGASGLTTDGSNLTVTGNVRAGHFIGDGSQLNNVPSSYSDSNVAAYLPTYTGDLPLVATVTAVGNISGQYILGNGYYLTGIQAGTNYSNANVASYLPVYTGNLNAGNISVTGNVGIVGNIQAGYLLGNGSQLTGLPAQYANSNVAAYLQIYTGNITANVVSATGAVKSSGTITATGNIYTSGYFVGNFAGNITGNLQVPGSNTQILYNSNGNAGASPFFTFDAANTVFTVAGTQTVTGNVTATNFFSSAVSATGNVTGAIVVGSAFTYPNGVSIINTYSNANVANYLANGSDPTIANITANVANNTSNITVLQGNVTSLTSNVANLNTALTSVTGVATTAAGNTVTLQANITSVGPLSAVTVTGGVVSATVSASGNVVSGNISVAGTTTVNTLTGNVISTTGNITTTGFFTVSTYTIAAINSIVGTMGQIASIIDAPIPGQLAYWDGTNNRWSYVYNNAGVF